MCNMCALANLLFSLNSNRKYKIFYFMHLFYLLHHLISTILFHDKTLYSLLFLLFYMRILDEILFMLKFHAYSLSVYYRLVDRISQLRIILKAF